MSRGHGRVQRAVLDYLATDPSGTLTGSGAPVETSLFRVTCAVFGVITPTDAQRASVGRAARKLHDSGLIVMTERVSAGRWDKNDPNGRFYTRRRRRGPLLTEQVAVSEKFISRLPTPEENARYRAVLRSYTRK